MAIAGRARRSDGSIHGVLARQRLNVGFGQVGAAVLEYAVATSRCTNPPGSVILAVIVISGGHQRSPSWRAGAAATE